MRKNTCIISFVASLTLATLIAFGSKCLSATPFGEAQIEIAQKRISEEESVKGPEHYSRIYDHGFRTQKSLLIMHGLHESPRYMEGFAQYFYQKGYNVFSVLLSGHMRKDATAIDKVKYEEWLNDAEQSFKIANGLGQNLEVLGYSTGGTLAAYLALRHPQDIKALYLIAPALALSSKVFFSSLMLGQSSLDSLKICQNADATNWMCRLFKFSDDQAQVMLRDRIVTSPSAGYQVQSLINFIDRTFNSSEDQTDYYQSLLEVYNKLSVPILMVNSKSDNVINLDFNEKFIQSYKARKENILFEKSLGIKHIFINKSSVDAFLNTKPGYNLHFEEITSGVERLQ